MLGASKAGILGAAAGANLNAVTWDTGTSNGNYTFDNSDLDAHKVTGDSTWGHCAVVGKVLTAADKYSIDLEVISKEPVARDNFGINATGDGGTVTSGGYLSQNLTDHHYGIQPEGSVSASDIVTIQFDGPGAEIKFYINNSLNATISISTSVDYRFAYGNYRTGGEARIREQVYAPTSGFTKLTA
jgi:hypothetical protein